MNDDFAPTSSAAHRASEPGVTTRTVATQLQPRVSFILPAYNEAKFIATTLRAIHEASAGQWPYEVIVVDNGSTDSTAALARANHATVITVASSTIARVRNQGAAHSSGLVLVFLDADVILTPEWAKRIHGVLQELEKLPRLVTGSACGVPQDSSWLETTWFGPLQSGRSSHINSGHLVVTSSFFRELGGFDEELETGEDYDFSTRAVAAGGRLRPDPDLAVVHLGFPRTLPAFLRREIWHGRGDFRSLRSTLRSPVAVASIGFLALHITLLIMLVTRFWSGALAVVAVIALICVTASIRQYRGNSTKTIGGNSAVYYLYFWGRALALLSALRRRHAFVHRDGR